MPKNPKVSLVKSPDSYSGVTTALKLIEKEVKLARKVKKRVLIKPNMVSVRHPLASTPVEAVRAVLDFLLPFVKSEIIIAEGSAENTEKAFKRLGFYNLKRGYKIKFVDLNKDKVGKEVKIMDAAGYPVKVDIAKTIKPHLSVIDGTVSMEGEGPAFGTPKKTNFAVAGLDPLAVDSLVTSLMGFNLKDVGYLKLMDDNRIGQGDLSKIVVLGEKPGKFQYRFKPHPTHKRQILWQNLNLPPKTLISKIIGLTLGKVKKMIPGRLIIEMQEIGPLRQFVTRIQNGF